MDKILILVPTEKEAAFFALHGLRAHICGVGMAECAAATAGLLAESLAVGARPEYVVLAGIAGSYVDSLAVGDTVAVASETVADLGRREADGRFTPFFQKMYNASLIPSGLTAVRSNTVNSCGCEPNGAEIENMEGAAFLAICQRFGVRAMEVRTISNRVGESVTAENLELAARRLAAGIKEMVKK
jgi:nucleoside phosphorylase